MALQIGTIYMAYQIGHRFQDMPNWPRAWFAFGVALSGMLMSRIFVILLASGVESTLVESAHRFVSPLIVNLGLFVGMLILHLALPDMRTLRDAHARSPVAEFTVDDQSQILHWDAGAERLFGVPASEAIGTNFMCLTAGSPAMQAKRITIADRGQQAVLEGQACLEYSLTMISRACPEREFLVAIQLRPVTIEGRQCFQGKARRLIYSF